MGGDLVEGGTSPAGDDVKALSPLSPTGADVGAVAGAARSHDIAPGLYGMIDPAVVVPGAPRSVLHAEALRQGTLLLEEGVRTVQLRDKGGLTSQRLALLADLVAITERLGRNREDVCWVVNDDVDVVRAARQTPSLRLLAHLGQDDGPDPDFPFGRSTHDLDQVVHAAGHATYLGFGPVFGTTTKDTRYTPRGVDALAAAVRVSPVPVVAIGGITLENLQQVQATGAHAWAVIGAIWRAPDPRRSIKSFSLP